MSYGSHVVKVFAYYDEDPGSIPHTGTMREAHSVTCVDTAAYGIKHHSLTMSVMLTLWHLQYTVTNLTCVIEYCVKHDCFSLKTPKTLRAFAT